MSDKSKDEILSAIQRLNEKVDSIEDSQKRILSKQNKLIGLFFHPVSNKDIVKSVSDGIAKAVACYS